MAKGERKGGETGRLEAIVPAEGDRAYAAGRFRFFLREALRRLWVSRRTSFVAILMITISLVILGSFLLLSENLNQAMDQWQGRSKLTIWMDLDATPEAVRAVDMKLARSSELSHRRFISREKAMARFRAFFTDLRSIVDDLGENPFPPSFDVEVTPLAIQSRSLDGDVAAIRDMPGVDDVEFDWEWTAKMRNLIHFIDLTGLLVGGILAFAAAFTIANVTRLTMILYREEIEIMRLVGATETIIRSPFLIEGVLQGTIGGLLAVGILFVGFEGARHFVSASNALLVQFLFLTFLPLQKIAALIAGGTASGLIGSWLSLRDNPEEKTVY
jgi:cell division transport system permease protein